MSTFSEGLVEEVLSRLHQRQKANFVVALNGSASEYQQRMVDALTQSAQCLFETMCGWPLTQTSVQHGLGLDAPRHDVSGIISISGKLRATIVVSLTKELAFGAAESLLGANLNTINAEVIDLVGELTNMISGNAKERMAMEGLTLGLPTVVAGPDFIVAFESGLAMSQLAFTCQEGSLSIQLGMATR